MAIAFDAYTRVFQGTVSGGLCTVAHTIGSVTDPFIAVAIAKYQAFATAVTYNGVALTKRVSAVVGSHLSASTAIWTSADGLPPATGTHNIVVSYSDNFPDFYIVSFGGVVGTTPVGNTNSRNDLVSQASPLSTSITMSAGSVALDVMHHAQGTLTVDGSQTQLTAAVASQAEEGSYKAGATAMVWTYTGGTNWGSQCVIEMKVATAAPSNWGRMLGGELNRLVRRI